MPNNKIKKYFALFCICVFSLCGGLDVFATPSSIPAVDFADYDVKETDTGTEVTYYITATYEDHISGNEIAASERTLIESDFPEDLEFVDFVHTENGTIGARDTETLESCGDIGVIDETGDVGWDDNHEVYSYAGVTYNATTRKISFETELLVKNCIVTVGVVAKTPALIDDLKTPEKELGRLFPLSATATEGSLMRTSNNLAVVIGEKEYIENKNNTDNTSNSSNLEKVEDTPSSPKTDDNLVLFAVLMIISCAGVVISVLLLCRKDKENGKRIIAGVTGLVLAGVAISGGDTTYASNYGMRDGVSGGYVVSSNALSFANGDAGAWKVTMKAMNNDEYDSLDLAIDIQSNAFETDEKKYDDFVVKAKINSQYWGVHANSDSTITGNTVIYCEVWYGDQCWARNDSYDGRTGNVTYDSNTSILTWNLADYLYSGRSFKSGEKYRIYISLDAGSRNGEHYGLGPNEILPVVTEIDVLATKRGILDEHVVKTANIKHQWAYTVAFDKNSPNDCEAIGDLPKITDWTDARTINTSGYKLSCEGWTFKRFSSPNSNFKRIQEYVFSAIWGRPVIRASFVGEVVPKGVGSDIK